jgi:hypothetical protein
MATYKLDYRLVGPQMYEDDGRKLMRDYQRGNIAVNASNLDEAKKKAKPLIKNSKLFSNFTDRFPVSDPAIKPRIKFLKGAGGSSGDSPVREIETKLLIKPKKYGQSDL